MNKTAMNVIEILSAKYNFSAEEAMTLFTTKPKKNAKKNAGQSLQDMFAELVNDVEQDNRGPAIETVVVEPAPVDDMTKALMALENKYALSAMKEQKKIDDLAAKETAKKQKEEEKLAAKAALLKQKEEEKAAAKEALKKQKDEEKAAAKEALKKQKDEEKAAAKEALKKQKDEEKAAAKEALKKQKVVKEKVVKEPKAKAEKVVKEPKAKAVKTKDVKEPTTDAAELPPVKVTVTRIKIDDQTYLKSAAGNLYNVETKEEVGLHDEATNTIKPLPDDDEEELEEDEYAEDNL
jgi:hypothetical protein